MKKAFILSASLLAAFALMSCTNSKNLPKKLDSFVNNAELKCDSYSVEDWDKSIAEYDKLIEILENSDVEYTKEEKKMIVNAIGRYHSLLIKKTVSEGAELFKDLGETAPDYIDGIMDGLDDASINSDEIEDAIDELEDTIDDILN